VDLAHPCSSEVHRWVSSGLFQPIDTKRLTNWKDVIPALWDQDFNPKVDGNPYFAPFDWGQTSFAYRTDLVDLEGKEESWGLMWDERFKKKMSVIGAAGEAWWTTAIYAGIPFTELATKANMDKVAALLRKQRPLVRSYTQDAVSWEQMLVSGEVVMSMCWNSTPKEVQNAGITDIKFANPKEGALTWVCGFMIHKDAPKLDLAYELLDSLLAYNRSLQLVKEENYGCPNIKALKDVPEADLNAIGLSQDAQAILDAGKFQIPMGEKFEHDVNKKMTEIMAGF
jgi:spermidine/putrescine transport system substrate-binding protein